MKAKLPKNVVLFDGICVLCNSSVQYLIKKDGEKKLKFAAIGSDFYKKLVQEYPEISKVDAIIFFDGLKVYTASDAVLKIAEVLGNGFGWLSPLKYGSKTIRNSCYKLIAKNRYWLFGKNSECMLPAQGEENRFLT